MYEIAEYDKRYMPRDKSRHPLAHADYVKLPVKPKGDGLKTLLKHKRGLEVFAIWCLLLEKTTLEKPENRGKLLNHREQPASTEEIAMSISLEKKVKLIEYALSLLTAIGWLNCAESAGKCGESAPLSVVKCSEVKSSEDKINRWKLFYEPYPRKVKRDHVIEWFEKHQPSDDDIERMLNCMKLQKVPGGRLYITKATRKERMKYIPHPTTWLNDGDWKEAPTNAEIGDGAKEQAATERADRERSDEKIMTKIRSEEGPIWREKTTEKLRASLKVGAAWQRLALIKEILAERQGE